MYTYDDVLAWVTHRLRDQAALAALPYTHRSAGPADLTYPFVAITRRSGLASNTLQRRCWHRHRLIVEVIGQTEDETSLAPLVDAIYSALGEDDEGYVSEDWEGHQYRSILQDEWWGDPGPDGQAFLRLGGIFDVTIYL